MVSKNTLTILKIARNIATRLGAGPGAYKMILTESALVSERIRSLLSSPKPCMIARFGTSEINAVLNYISLQDNRGLQYLRYITGKKPFLNWDEQVLRGIFNNAGFFPPDVKLLEKYAALMLEDMKEVDLLGSWVKEEYFLNEELKNAEKVRLRYLEPYYHDNPWSAALEHKKVLVIHPFEESIRNQYAKRKLLFKNQRVLPEFELLTLKSIQPGSETSAAYATWFDALESMKEKIAATNFDVALIGCGAYGFPLAAFVKRQGKKAVHLGGSIQLLFGIKGHRWDSHPIIPKFYNEHWTRPLPSETPSNYKTIENGCYW